MKTRALLLALPLLALSQAGCVDNRASVTLNGICAPSSACTFAAKCDAYFAGNPAMDAVGSPDGELLLFIEVANQLPDNSSTDLQRTNTNAAHVDQIKISYQGIGLPAQVIGTQQRVQAGGTSVLGVPVIQASAANLAALAAYAPTATPLEMTAVLKLGGYYDDGTRFETGEFPIAIDVCSACLAGCPAGKVISCGSLGTQPIGCL
jgi:hypothetical protein